jgi:hypothetical protein
VSQRSNGFRLSKEPEKTFFCLFKMVPNFLIVGRGTNPSLWKAEADRRSGLVNENIPAKAVLNWPQKVVVSNRPKVLWEATIVE